MSENKWLQLDNAAKIYPAFAHKHDPATFRVAAVMERTIIPESLQRALDLTIVDFPSMAVTLRRGLFWAYLDENKKACLIKEESNMPCAYINLSKSNGYLFSVFYYDKRISLECFHALTDGYGAFEFLKALIYHYLNDFMQVDPGSLRLNGKSPANLSDGYKLFANHTKHKMQSIRARHIKGSPSHLEGVYVQHGLVSVDDIKKTVKAMGTTITVFLTALYIKSIFENRKKGPIVIAVPINLRNMFKLDTLRNFVYVMNIAIDEDMPLEAMIKLIENQFQAQLEPEVLRGQFSQNVSFEELFFMRVMPNVLKSFFLKQARTFKMKRIVTSVLTNPGIITLPQSMVDHVSHFEMVIYASKPHNINMGLVSYNNQLLITLSRCIEEREIIDHFFDSLKDKIDGDLLRYSNEGE